MTQYSDVNGNTAAARDPATGKIYGPYIRAIPPLPVGLKKGNAKITVATNPTGSPPKPGLQGWWYNCATGDVRANTSDAMMDDTGVRYNEY